MSTLTPRASRALSTARVSNRKSKAKPKPRKRREIAVVEDPPPAAENWTEQSGTWSVDPANTPHGGRSTSLPDGIAALDPEAAPRQNPAVSQTVEYDAIDLAIIAPNPWQPRQEFDGELIGKLAASLSREGQLQPIRVRRDGDGYQIIDGERRFRAAKLARWQTIRAEIVNATDADMARLALVANLQRENLNPIEQAEAIRRLIDEHGHDHAAAAEVLGCSKSQVSNRLRLLKLDAFWRERLISGEISTEKAREIATFADYPVLLDLFAAAWTNEFENLSELTDTKQFREELEYLIADAGRPMQGSFYDRERGISVKVRKPTDAAREELQIVAIGEAKNRREFALNLPAWEELHADAFAKADSQRNANTAKVINGTSAKKPTAAEEAKRARERTEQFQRHVAEWRSNWLRYLLAAQLLTPDDAEIEFAFAGLLWLAECRPHWQDCERARKPLAANKSLGPIATTDPKLMLFSNYDHAACRYVAGLLWDHKQQQPVEAFDNDIVEIFAKHAQLDLLAAWKSDAAGPLTQPFWNLHSKEQLADEFRRIHGAEPGAGTTKAKLVTWLTESRDARNALPAALAPKPQKATKKRKPR